MDLIRVVFNNPEYHKKITVIHKFFEISCFNFDDTQTKFYKQISVSK